MPHKAPTLLAMICITGICIGLLGGQLTACTPTENPTDGGITDSLPTDTSGQALVYKACTDATKVGEFRIDLATDFTSVQGQVLTGVTPQNVPEVVQSEGPCQLVKSKKLFCDPACAPGESCNEDGKCTPSPTGHDVGNVDITGLKAAVSMAPRAPIYFYTFTGTMPHPGFGVGDILQLTAAGGKGKSFVLRGVGIDALEVDTGGTNEVEVSRDKAVELKWKAPTQSGPTKISVRLNINNHGGAANWITCEAEDTGTLQIPATLVTKLFEAGTSGFPDLAVSRRSADSTDLEVGCTQFIVNATVTLSVKVPGLTSCSSNDDCPQGKTCQADLTCSE